MIVEIGAPDRDVGSGLHILEYRLQDGSRVWVGFADNAMIIYVRHGRGPIGDGEILYQRRP